MKIRELLKEWEARASAPLTARTYAVKFPVTAAARVHALAEMYPTRSVEQLISELLSAALDEVERSFPYMPGSEVVAEDEQGDPIYKDAGMTPRFQELTQKHLRLLKARRQPKKKTRAAATKTARRRRSASR